MSDEDRYGFELSEDSLKHVEAGAAAHRAAMEINRALRDKLAQIEIELTKVNAENGHLRIANHDLAAKLEKVEDLLRAEIAYRATFATLVQGLSSQIVQFMQSPVPTWPPVDRDVNPVEERPQAVLTGIRVPQDAKNGDGGDLPKGFLTARSRLASTPEKDRQ